MGRTWRRNGSEYDPTRESWRGKRDKRQDKRLKKLLKQSEIKKEKTINEEEDIKEFSEEE